MRCSFMTGATIVALLLLAQRPAGAQDRDAAWPRHIAGPSGAIAIYQPQFDNLSGSILRGRAATSVTPRGADQPVFGVIWFDATVDVDRSGGTLAVRAFDVTRVRFPDYSADQLARYEDAVEREAPGWNLVLALDRVQAGLRASEAERASANDYRSEPPRIIFSETPAALVVIDGEPELRPVENSTWQRVVNTPVLLFANPGAAAWLYNGRNWYTADHPLGPWRDVARAPRDVQQLVPRDTTTEPDSGATPRIIVATTPAELIVTDGAPQWTPVAGNELLYVDNTESNVLREIATGRTWVLLAGRWFAARSLEGPWAFVPPDSLPLSFRSIPPDSPIGDVLAQVPGTEAAEDAVRDAEIPQAAVVERSEARLDVEYDGEARFESISGMTTDEPMLYAVNTGSSVIKIGPRYYAVENGMWFVGGSPYGPWLLSDEVPAGVMFIPPSSPVYHVRYVQVYWSTPKAVYVGYLPGYIGSYRYHGTVIYGTGWHYRPWIGRDLYYPRPLTWGAHMVYNPWTGAWGMSYGWSASFVNVYVGWYGWRYHRPAWYGGWWGPGGYRPVYRPRPAYRPPWRPPRNVVVIRDHREVRRPRVTYPTRVPQVNRNVYARDDLRRAVVTRDRPTIHATRPVARPAPQPARPTARPAPAPPAPPAPPSRRPAPPARSPEPRAAPRPQPPPPSSREAPPARRPSPEPARPPSGRAAPPPPPATPEARRPPTNPRQRPAPPAPPSQPARRPARRDSQP